MKIYFPTVTEKLCKSLMVLNLNWKYQYKPHNMSYLHTCPYFLFTESLEEHDQTSTNSKSRL